MSEGGSVSVYECVVLCCVAERDFEYDLPKTCGAAIGISHKECYDKHQRTTCHTHYPQQQASKQIDSKYLLRTTLVSHPPN